MANEPITVIFEPQVRAGLVRLADMEGLSRGQLVNEAVRRYVESRTGGIAADIAAIAQHLRTNPDDDPTGEESMLLALRAEFQMTDDPAQGVIGPEVEQAGAQVRRLLDTLGA